MTASRRRGSLPRVLVLHLILGGLVLCCWAVVGDEAPVLAGFLALVLPGLFLLRRFCSAFPASWWALLTTAAAVVLTATTQVGSYAPDLEELLVVPVLGGGALGLLRGLSVRPVLVDGRRVLKGLALPLFLWQGSVLGTQLAVLPGLLNLVRLFLVAQAFLAGIATCALVSALLPLALRRSPAPPPGRAVVLRRLAMLLVLPLAALLVAQGRGNPRSGVYEGVLDPGIVRRQVDRCSGEGNSLAVTGGRMRLAIHGDGSAELLEPATCTIVWTMYDSRETFEHTFRPAGRAGPGILQSEHDEAQTSYQGQNRWNASAHSQTDRRHYRETNGRVEAQADGSVLVKLGISYQSVWQDMPWRCSRVADLGAAGSSSPGIAPGSGTAPGADHLGSALGEILSHLDHQGDLGEDARDAGVVAGLLALLAGASVQLASLIAGASAAAANRPPAPPTRTPGTVTLSGDRARDWLHQHGYIDDQDRFTDRYHDWTDRLHDDGSDPPLQLIQYYGHHDPGRPGQRDPFLPSDADVDIIVYREPEPEPEPIVPPEAPEPQEPLEPDEPEPPPKPPKPPWKEPCIDEERALAEVNRRGELLIAEMDRLKDRIREVRRERDATTTLGVLNALVDALSTSVTIAATAAGGFLSTLPGSLVQNAVADTIKKCLHEVYSKDPDNFFWNVFKSDFASTLAAAVAHTLEQLALSQGAVRYAWSPTAARAMLDTIVRVISGGLQTLYTSFNLGQGVRATIIKRALLDSQLRNLAQLRKKTYALVEEERANRVRAEAALAECRARALAGETTP